MPSLIHPGRAVLVERGDDRDDAAFPADEDGAPLPGFALRWQAAVLMLDSDEWGPDVWEARDFATKAEAREWAAERAAWRLPAGAYPRPIDLRPVAVVLPVAAS